MSTVPGIGEEIYMGDGVHHLLIRHDRNALASGEVLLRVVMLRAGSGKEIFNERLDSRTRQQLINHFEGLIIINNLK